MNNFRVVVTTVVLIETLWNVNVKQSIIFNDSETGINRNIVECKYTTCKATYRTDNVLIETLWNVNAFFRIHGASSPPY